MSNSKLYDEIVNELSLKFKDLNISKLELERIIDSQFRSIRDSIGRKNAEVTMLQYLGKIVPSKAHVKYVENKRNESN